MFNNYLADYSNPIPIVQIILMLSEKFFVFHDFLVAYISVRTYQPTLRSRFCIVPGRGARRCHFSEPAAACTKRYRRGGAPRRDQFFSMYNVCLQTGRAVTANKRCMLYFTVPCACELYKYVTPEKVSSSEQQYTIIWRI